MGGPTPTDLDAPGDLDDPDDPDAPTGESAVFSWARAEAVREDEVLHLVVAAFPAEPERVGQVATLDAPKWLGRGEARDDDMGARLEFCEQRPGITRLTKPLASNHISRRQLEFTPQPSGRVRVRCVGRRPLRHEERRVVECVAEAGDLLELEGTAVFLLERRPRSLARSRHYGAPAFEFGRSDPQGLVGESPAAWALRDELAGAAASQAHVLIQGESGSGKELAARIVHERSARAGGPWVARSAATLPTGLAEAELFGSARNYPHAGAAEREGLIGAAHGGTLLLDELGELPEAEQARLLRVVDNEGEYHRLGESRGRRSDFRLVSATNRPLDHLKHDLAARLTVRVEVPGLMERRSDIPLLTAMLLERLADESPGVRERFFEAGPGGAARLDPLLVATLLRHRYTHHTRELERLLRLALTTSPDDFLTLTAELEQELAAATQRSAESTPPSDPERERIVAVLSACEGSRTLAAEQLGMSRHALRNRLIKYGVTTR